MAEIKYLDLTGLGYYDSKIKEYILSQVGGGDVTIDALKAAAGGAVAIEWTKGGIKQADVVLSHADLIAAIGEVDATEAGLMSVADKAKLDDIEAGAQVNVIESISINGEAFAIADKAATAELKFGWGESAEEEPNNSDIIVLKIGNTEIGRINTTKFVKDGIVKNAELITIPDDEAATTEHPAGKYIKITWSDDATTDPTYINVTDLVDIHNVVGDAVASGSLVKVNTTVTGKGTTAEPWKVSVVVDETALNAELKNYVKSIQVGDAAEDVVTPDESGKVVVNGGNVELTADINLDDLNVNLNDYPATGDSINDAFQHTYNEISAVHDRIDNLDTHVAITNGEIDALFA